VQNYEDKDIKTHKGYDLTRMSMGELYKEYGLDPMTIDFIGHALALYRDDFYAQVRLPLANW
jgi:Rab GDP dissociation inhibitor